MLDNLLDIYHRAFKLYCRELGHFNKAEKNSNVSKLENAIVNADCNNDRLYALRYYCDIKTDWIERIEEAVPYLEKAVNENRQFILHQGNTVIIEKAKNISKTSVEHLAKHSEFLTKEPEPGGDIIPDKIYVTEKINNFAIYENRFLYMLLKYTQDFIEIRYKTIIEMWNKFQMDISMDKKISIGNRKIEFQMKCSEISVNETITSYDEETKNIIKRIEKIQLDINSLLQTPLMKEVSNSPLLKPPITKTNVLRMNVNFKKSMELYEFLCDYSEDGYTVHEIREEATAFEGEMGLAYAQMVSICTYLSYCYGGHLKDIMESRYKLEELRRKEEYEKVRAERLIMLKEQLEKNRDNEKLFKQKLEEYLYEIQETVDNLEKCRAEAVELQRLLTDCEADLLKQKDSNSLLETDIRELNKTISMLKIQAQESERQYSIKIEQITEECNNIVSENNKKMKEEEDKRYAVQAQLHGLKEQYGLLSADEDYSSKERFGELEREREAFNSFFKKQWKTAKKQIRLKYLWQKNKE